jgi:hypothetical protein
VCEGTLVFALLSFHPFARPRGGKLGFEQGGVVPGAHSFKFVGVNSGGSSDASAPIVIQVT